MFCNAVILAGGRADPAGLSAHGVRRRQRDGMERGAIHLRWDGRSQASSKHQCCTSVPAAAGRRPSGSSLCGA